MQLYAVAEEALREQLERYDARRSRLVHARWNFNVRGRRLLHRFLVEFDGQPDVHWDLDDDEISGRELHRRELRRFEARCREIWDGLRQVPPRTFSFAMAAVPGPPAPAYFMVLDPAAGPDRTVMTYRGIPVRVVDEIAPRPAGITYVDRDPRPLIELQRRHFAQLEQDMVDAILYGNGAPGPPVVRENMTATEVQPRQAAPGYRRQTTDASAKAEKLLREWLSPEQLQQYEQHKFFLVRGCDTGRLYRIFPTGSFNIEEIGPEGAVAALCFAPEGRLALGDQLLAQKIALECRENQALKVANRSDIESDGMCACAICRDEPKSLFNLKNRDRITLAILAQRPPEPIDSSAWTGR